MKPPRIYLSPPDMSADDLSALTEAFASNWIAPVGPALDDFERLVCEATESAHAVALASGTSGLHLGLLEVGVRPGDRVFCSTLSFIASANAIAQCGAEPVFIDSERTSWNLDSEALSAALKEAAGQDRLPAAVEVVQAYGQCADMAPILALCEEYGVPLVEDAAEAVGATYQGKAAGTLGKVGVYSFNGNKIITTSGGGMLLTSDAALADHVRKLSTQAREPDREYLHRELGYNYRLSNLLAAIGYSQFKALPEKITRRRAIFERYVEQLGSLSGVSFMPEASWGQCTRWLTALLIDPEVAGVSRDEILDALEAENIEGRPLWRPLHSQPYYAQCARYGGEVAEALFAQGLCLPSSSALSETEQDRVVAVVEGVFAGAQKR
ncbi:MAG: aminotransferase class I/II-fold pyridoxal phosphate-dependent enzyme [Verrucomicrobiota bacterium]